MNKRLKVLIADDEPNIREGIRDSLDWNAVGMEVIAEAEDGEEALELAIKYEIDILLVDINMPIMNGLTLIGHIQKLLPKCRVIIISGYDEFSYAQQAIRLQVDEYILKPVKPETLLTVIDNIREKIVSEMKQDRYLEMASNHISKNTIAIQERFCREWVEGMITEEEIIEHLRFLRLPERRPDVLMVIRNQEFQLHQSAVHQKSKKDFISRVNDVVYESLDDKPYVLFSDDSGLLFLILWGQLEDEWFPKVEHLIEDYLDLTVTMYFEHVRGELSDLSKVYLSCKKNIQNESKLTPMVRRARNYMMENFADSNLTLESIANNLQVSPVYLSRMIKQELGTPFVTLLTEMRMKKAIKLLNSTNLPLYEIAEEVGYDNQHYFSTAFKKVVGVSPNQYRKGTIQRV